MSGTVGCTSQSMECRAVGMVATVAAALTKKSPGLRRGQGRDQRKRSLETVENLVGPEPLETMQRLVERAELLGIDAADLLHRAHVLLVERIDDVAHLAALVGELDAHRAAVDARALVIKEAHLDELLEIVGDVGAEIVAARAQLAGGQLLLSDIVQQQGLYRIDVGAAATVELVLDDVEQAAMQPLDQGQGFEIKRTDVVEPRFAIGRLRRL